MPELTPQQLTGLTSELQLERGKLRQEQEAYVTLVELMVPPTLTALRILDSAPNSTLTPPQFAEVKAAVAEIVDLLLPDGTALDNDIPVVKQTTVEPPTPAPAEAASDAGTAIPPVAPAQTMAGVSIPITTE